MNFLRNRSCRGADDLGMERTNPQMGLNQRLGGANAFDMATRQSVAKHRAKAGQFTAHLAGHLADSGRQAAESGTGGADSARGSKLDPGGHPESGKRKDLLDEVAADPGLPQSAEGLASAQLAVIETMVATHLEADRALPMGLRGSVAAGEPSPDQLAAQMMRRLAIQHRGEETTLSIELSAPGMDHVGLALQVKDGRLRAFFSVPDLASQALIRSAAGQLESGLEARGIGLQELRVDQQAARSADLAGDRSMAEHQDRRGRHRRNPEDERLDQPPRRRGQQRKSGVVI